jgi:hypothetical protein
MFTITENSAALTVVTVYPQFCNAPLRNAEWIMQRSLEVQLAQGQSYSGWYLTTHETVDAASIVT